MNKHQSNSIIVGMSGGVDSTVAALLLKQQGFNVAGLFMKNWEEDDVPENNYCNATIDLAHAQAACNKLNIDLLTINFATEYWDLVFKQFLAEYQAGRTPNPDILCNNEIKFKLFLGYAKQLNADLIATGHYARTYNNHNEVLLLTASDQNKDQSYFLHGLKQPQLNNCLFPIGELNKQQVRKIAQEFGFENYNKKDSTGICFIGERKFKDFLSKYLPFKTGKIIDEFGNVLGEHDGIYYYTIGQRKGLRIGGNAYYKDLEAPWYVIDKDPTTNTLTVVRGHNHPKLFNNQLLATKVNWISEKLPDLTKTYTAKIRYRQAAQQCRLKQIGDLEYLVLFTTAQRAISPGQYIVFYDQNICLGGGIIHGIKT